MGVYFGQDYSAMQGPTPDGFHVPLNTEWQAVRDIRVALGGGSSDGTNFGIALKLPFAGYRRYSSADVLSQGTYGSYWSSSRYNANYAYNLYFISTALGPQDNSRRAYGFSVRCFKNSSVVPTSNWTKLYGTSIESGGIFWSSADGLISLSSDGITWITIADKNLGATTVWNSGDTLSETNCGKYYQWGNNYGFPRTGTIANQSTTQVDASNYGPGNYYSSDTFIKYNGRWDTTDNGNLRGGETGVSLAELKNAYIGEYGWHPGANTIAYFPFTDNVDDSTGKYSLTRTNLTKGTIGYTFTQSGGNIHLSTDVQESTKFVGIWFKASSSTNIYKNMGFLGCNKLGGIQYWLGHTSSSTRSKIQTYTGSGWTVQTSNTWSASLGNWHYLAYSLVGTTLYVCKDGTVSTVLTATPYDYGGDMALCNFGSGASCSIEVSDWIMEDTGWSSDAMTEYYNGAKAKYGIN